MKQSKLFDVLVVILLVGLALFIRHQVRDFLSGDPKYYYLQYYDTIQERDLVEALGSRYGKSVPLYTYGLILASYLPMPGLYAIKLGSVIFDFICAVWVYLIVKRKYGESYIPWIAGIAVLFLPTVIVNSSVWGQWDSVYTSFLLGALYYMMRLTDPTVDPKDELFGFKAVTLFSVALAAKLQAVFFVLPLIWGFLINKLKWQLIVLIPIIFFLFMVPQYVAGVPFKDLIDITTDQIEAHPNMRTTTPNAYQFISSAPSEGFTEAAVALAAAAVVATSWAIYRYVPFAPTNLLNVALLSTLIIPYLLPRMHSRYFYPADIISLIVAFYQPRLWYVPCVVVTVSFLSHLPYLFRQSVLPFPILALILGATIIMFTRNMILDLRKQQSSM